MQEFYTGQALYEATVQFETDMAVVDPHLLLNTNFTKAWEDLSWEDQDHWEARADELNEARN